LGREALAFLLASPLVRLTLLNHAPGCLRALLGALLAEPSNNIRLFEAIADIDGALVREFLENGRRYLVQRWDIVGLDYGENENAKASSWA